MIVVTTPTGHIGSKVLDQLIHSKVKIRIFARDPSKLTAEQRAKAEVVQGSLDDFDSVSKAYHGADQVFYILPPSMACSNIDDYFRQMGKVTCDAIESEKVKRVLFVSGTGLGYDKKAGPVSSSFLVEEMLEASGAATRILHCGTFMENLMHAVQPMKFKGEFSTSVPGDVKLPWVATQDIADASVKLLLDPTWSGKGSVGVLGPEDLSYNDLSRMISESLGKSVQYKTVSGEALKATVMQYGATDASAQGLVDIYNSMTIGTFNRVKRTPESSSPTHFKTWCDRVLKPAVSN